ncbi:MAG: hypothetical protein RMJ00_05530 [Nitrososphaerota archaeon]|nr:hypothetical protein [Candidatus Bathyarchaeota archaeon]MDW8062140.1 hypothetical protein [Nitrososphaerota archaeon]
MDIPRVILGCLPFLGESYQGAEKNRLYVERFSDSNETMKILRSAYIDYGIRVIAAPTYSEDRLVKLFFLSISKLRDEGVNWILAPCISIPLTVRGERMDDVKRWVTYIVLESKSMMDAYILRERYLRDPILSCRSGWREIFSKALTDIKPYEYRDFQELSVDSRLLEERASYFDPDVCLFVELGSEIDLLTLTHRLDLIGECMDILRSVGFDKIFVGSHHAGSVIPILEESDLSFEGYVTPLNPIGALMLPSKESVEYAVANARRQIIAIKPLAGGRVGPIDAFRYIFKSIGVKSVMIGVASMEELAEDMDALIKASA